MKTSRRIIAIVPAAGVGARAAGPGAPDGQPLRPKQYRHIAGQPMLRHAVQALLADARVEQVVVAVSAEDPWAQAALAGLERVSCLACGGATRAETVANALARCGAEADDWVLVHDAARPGLPAPVLAALIDACAGDDTGGLVAMPVADTIKAQAGGPAPRVARTVPRDGLWQAQTPQMFRAALLRKALAHAQVRGLDITDEAGAVEALGLSPRLVPGSLANFKVTWPQDFALIEQLLNRP
ncbi:2-C-methyl-D-erythritol 4-phosphate cytidylyltransferase [Pigmentiphaga humi]|uniref:2-C-methyl-D-erythritol 4-phosphate cytidylyltransferase n=1 Tax=Pigmentiphaga humi TaxID=2478468 RepID=A0A3P4B1W9_9BURK|nr:2-C-methyl-D-erythritol 4-phosphate cytidylyltransferase [Pigmentiphaga humi]VCU70289.1 2-C-methyl-D-erythritol 4-phosphate cytidylyltransferase [Pigmentiphaga humi]